MQIACSPKMNPVTDLEHNHGNRFAFDISRGAPLYLSNLTLGCSNGQIEVYSFDSKEVIAEIPINTELSIDSTRQITIHDTIFYSLKLPQRLDHLPEIKCPSMVRLVIDCPREQWRSDSLFYVTGKKFMTEKSFRTTIDTTLFVNGGVYYSFDKPELNALHVNVANRSSNPITIDRSRVQFWAIDSYMNRFDITESIIPVDTVLNPHDSIFVKIPKDRLMRTSKQDPIMDGMRLLIRWYSPIRQCWVELGEGIKPKDRSQWNHSRYRSHSD